VILIIIDVFPQVSAQKQLQSLKNIPASMATMDGKRLADTGIIQ